METFRLVRPSYVRSSHSGDLKKGVPLYLCNSKKKETTFNSLPPSPPLVISIDAWETESRLRPLGQIPLHVLMNRIARPKLQAWKWIGLEDVDDWLYKHSGCHPGQQTVHRHRIGCRHLTPISVCLGGYVNAGLGCLRSRHKVLCVCPSSFKTDKDF